MSSLGELSARPIADSLTKSARVDRQALDTRAQQLRGNPQFPAAKVEFCRNMTSCWLDTPINRLLIADTGAMAIAITIIGFSQTRSEAGAPLQHLIDILVAGKLASATRVRAMIDMMVDRGALAIHPHPSDGRRLVISPTDLLRTSFRIWFDSAMGPVARLFHLPAPPAAVAAMPGLALRYTKAVMLRHSEDGFTIFDNWPEAQAFADRRHGYVLMLHLAAESGLDVAVPRRSLAERYGVSPTHISVLLANAEAQGWLTRDRRSSSVTLAADFADRLDLWVAREIAVVGLWLEAKLPAR